MEVNDLNCATREAAWWREILRRCDEAERNSERLVDADAFFREVRADIEHLKSGMARSEA